MSTCQRSDRVAGGGQLKGAAGKGGCLQGLVAAEQGSS